jgi:hypothetical protein
MNLRVTAVGETTEVDIQPTNESRRARLKASPSWELARLWQQGERPDVRSFLNASGSVEMAEVVAAIRVDQHHRWRCGERVCAEDYFASYPALATNVESAVELIYSEFLLREELGESPTCGEYGARFPAYAERLKIQLDLRRAIDSAARLDECAPAPFWEIRSQQLDASKTAVNRTWEAQTVFVKGPQVDGYEILEVVGRGGMGVVYKARQLGLHRLVAIKMVLSGEYAEADHLERFRTEAEAAARLHHPHIVEIYSVGEQDGRPFLAMEYVEGGTLAQQLDGTPQPPAATAELIRTVAQAIQFAHERGVVHRDLKPANVLWSVVRGCEKLGTGTLKSVGISVVFVMSV